MSNKLIQCHRCGDPITNELGDNPICGPCALASELTVMTLQARITELEKLAVVWHKYPDEKPLHSGKVLMWVDNQVVQGVYDTYGGFSDAENWANGVTHWADVPEPPEVKE